MCKNKTKTKQARRRDSYFRGESICGYVLSLCLVSIFFQAQALSDSVQVFAMRLGFLGLGVAGLVFTTRENERDFAAEKTFVKAMSDMQVSQVNLAAAREENAQ